MLRMFFAPGGDEYLNKFVREGLVLDLTDFFKGKRNYEFAGGKSDDSFPI